MSTTDIASAPWSSATALLQVAGVTKRFGAATVVDDVSFTVAPGEVRGLCGHNGAGKSTVLRMISGQLAPDAGEVRIEGRDARIRSRSQAQRAGIALVDQELSVVPSLTVAENLALGSSAAGFFVRPGALRARSRALLDGVGLEHVDPDTLVSELGLGERQLIEVARAVSEGSRLLILDEPTATLNDAESAHVYAAVRRLAADGCGILFVSHRLGEVLRLCDSVTVLRDGKVVDTTPSAELTVPALIEQMLGGLDDVPPPARAADDTVAHTLSIHGLTVPGVVTDFTLDAHPGRIYALAGQVGSGTSDVLRALAGLHTSARGEVVVRERRLPLGDAVAASRCGIAFVSNDRKEEGLFLARSVGDNLLATRLSALSRAGLRRPAHERTTSRSLRELAGIPAALRARTGALSGGNQQKVFVARNFDRPGTSVLLVDEPTRGVDVGGRQAIHLLLREAADSGLVVIFTSTETEELLELGDVVITMRGGRMVARHDSPPPVATLLRETTHEEDAS
ncbi:sugar ABC transporter ATP-binding protein [Microbacterium sp. RD1]|uniref:sugar ABC transporter ATP-binding protein n=1 Tax=Microbacterium sp. RD1 TaxID=3457313 RepID=UPI003FA53F5D